MKKKIALILLLFIPFFIFSFSFDTPSLFDIDKELEDFNFTPVEKDEEEFFSSLEIYLLTGGEGSLVWENFGHTALVLSSPYFGDISFDYGTFTFDKNFIPKFIQGRLYYLLNYGYASYRLQSLESEDRDISLLKLKLTNDQKKAIYSFLLYEAEDENATYFYQYFLDNCATRPRDVYSYCTGGEFKEYAKSIKYDETLRESAIRYISRSGFLMSYLINFLLGPDCDKEITLWDAMYLPSVLEEAIEKRENSESTIIYKSQERKATPSSYSLLHPSLLLTLLLLILVLGSMSKKKVIYRISHITMGLINILFGILALLLDYLMLFTLHYVTKGNLNSLIVSPLLIVLGIYNFMSIRKNNHLKERSFIGLVQLIISLLVMITELFFIHQDSLAILVVFVPYYLLLALPLFLKKISHLAKS